MTLSRADQSWRNIKVAQQSNAATQAELLKIFPIEGRNVPNILKIQAKRYNDRVLFRCAGEEITFASAVTEAATWASMLFENGVKRGDRVAIICSNRPDFIRLFLGCAWLGAVSVPINTASRGFQLAHILNNCGARLLCIEDQFLTALDTLDPQSLELERLFVIGEGEATFGGLPVTPLPAPGDGIDAAELQPGDLLTVIYTSGTTGPSKGVRCPHAQYFWWGIYVSRQVAIQEGDVLHTTLPLFHSNALGCFFQALMMGATQVVENRFSVSKFWDRLQESDATITYVLGAMVPMLLSRQPNASEYSHKVRCALAPGVPAHLHEEFTNRSGIVLFDGYGATESNAVIGTDPNSYRPGAMGKVQPGFDARVVDQFDQPVSVGTPGELILRADEPFSMCDGYYEMADKTAKTWRNLWLHTGDRVVCDNDGYFTFLDRMKDAIRRRGENISSFEVEKVLTSHPSVGVAAVFAVPSELSEDEVMAVVTLTEGATVSEEELVHYCAPRMSYFSVPRFIEIAEDLPRTESGKVQKFKLRERGKTAHTWDRETAGVDVKR